MVNAEELEAPEATAEPEPLADPEPSRAPEPTVLLGGSPKTPPEVAPEVDDWTSGLRDGYHQPIPGFLLVLVELLPAGTKPGRRQTVFNTLELPDPGVILA